MTEYEFLEQLAQLLTIQKVKLDLSKGDSTTLINSYDTLQNTTKSMIALYQQRRDAINRDVKETNEA